MWKSVSFQQVFPVIAFPVLPVENLHSPMHTHRLERFRRVLRQWMPMPVFSLIPAKLFRFPGKLSGIKVTDRNRGQNFCEKLPKRKNGIIGSTLGNTFS